MLQEPGKDDVIALHDEKCNTVISSKDIVVNELRYYDAINSQYCSRICTFSFLNAYSIITL